MKDFLDQLDTHLRAIAEAESTAPAPAPTRARAARRRRPAILVGATTVLATLAAAFAINTVSFADLPILETPPTDASGIATAAESARKAGVDFSEAHSFPSVNGPGYVFATPDDDQLCLVVPDPNGVYPGACAMREEVEARGLGFEVVDDRGVAADAVSTFAYVLPDDARDVRIAGPGNVDGAVTLTSNVATGAIRAAVEIRWTQDGRPRSKSYDGPFAGGTTSQETCPDGRTIVVPLGSLRSAPSGRLDREALRKACG